MGFTSNLINSLISWQASRVMRQPGSVGDFYRHGGNKQLWKDLSITADDIVLDIGGYHGNWAAEMLIHYGCYLHIWEVDPSAQKIISERFLKNQRVCLHNQALGGADRLDKLALKGVGSSLHDEQRKDAIDVQVEDVNKFFNKYSDTQFACMKLNVEGAEYEILERMAENKLITRVNLFIIQFHNIPSINANQRREKIRKELLKTHKLVFDYPFVWECWKKN